MKAKVETYSAAIHSRSRRSLQRAFRCSAAEPAAATGARRRHSISTMMAASARMVMKKNKSLRTSGPISAISCRLEGSTPFSESSCRPLMTNCAATNSRITVVTRKNFCRLMRTEPLTNITPKTMARATPAKVPIKFMSAVELKETPARISTVSTPSRSTMKNTKANSPSREPWSAKAPTRPSICPLMRRAARAMKMTMVTVKAAASSITQPSKMS